MQKTEKKITKPQTLSIVSMEFVIEIPTADAIFLPVCISAGGRNLSWLSFEL